MQPDIDPDSPVPLYHQIAEWIRARIKSGELVAGEALEPLREAATTWGVNLHTVRHAYTSLARDGWVKAAGRRGTIIAKRNRSASPGSPGSQTEHQRKKMDAFARKMILDAKTRFGLSTADLASLVAKIAEEERPDSDVPVVWIVECSDWQCAGHASEIAGHYRVDARVWTLDRTDEPPAGDTVIATYFHYNDIRRVWPARLASILFVTIRPDQSLADLLPSPSGRRRLRVFVCERDEPTAQNIAADISVVLAHERFDIRTVVNNRPGKVLQGLGKREVAVFSPRVFAEMSKPLRSHPAAFEARYIFDETELRETARDLGWEPRASLVRTLGGSP